MKTDNRHKATISLSAAAAGLFLSYPYQHTFWGAFLGSGFSAALVGGLADWYAVTALFRKPLRIPYRTAVIPRNRERIFSAIISMVEEELLTVDNIKEKLHQSEPAKLLLDYIGQAESRRQLTGIAGEVAKAAVAAIDTAALSAACDLLLTGHKDKLKVAPLAGQALNWLLASGFADKLFDFAITELKQMIRQDYMAELMARMYSSALAAYAARQEQRKLTGWVLENLLSLDSVTVAGMLQQQVVYVLEELYQPDHHLRLQLFGWLGDFAGQLQTNDLLEEKAAAALRPVVVNLVEQLVRLPAVHPEIAEGLSQWLGRQAVKLTEDVMADPDKQDGLNTLIVDWLAGWVNNNHGEIGRLVGTYLNGFSDDRLVDYIETKVMNDLQMIRINGAIVGGLVGMVLFLITYAAGVGL